MLMSILVFLLCAVVILAAVFRKPSIFVGSMRAYKLLLAWLALLAMVRISPMVLQAVRTSGKKWSMTADKQGIHIDSSSRMRIAWEDVKEVRRIAITPSWTKGVLEYWGFNFRHLNAGPLVLLHSAPEEMECDWYAVRMYKFEETPVRLTHLIYPGYYHLRVEAGRTQAFEKAVHHAAGKKKVGTPIRTQKEYEKYIA